MRQYRVEVNGRTHEVVVHRKEGSVVLFEIEGVKYEAVVARDVAPEEPAHRQGLKSTASSGVVQGAPTVAPRGTPSVRVGSGEIRAPMPGIVVGVKAEPGIAVTKGQTIVVMEAMKMENNITAPKDGVLKSILVKAGQEVELGALLAEIV